LAGKTSRWKRIGTSTAVAALLAGVLGIGLFRGYLSYLEPPRIVVQSKGPNAVWAAHHWVGKPQVDRAYAELVTRLRRHRITDVFFHVGPLEPDGTLPPERFPAAAELLRQIRARSAVIRLQAWIGQREKRGGGPLDLSSEKVRANIVGAAESLLRLGFDGIHYNIEPVASGDADFLALLDATRVLTRDRGRVLSLAGNGVEPMPGLAWLIGLTGKGIGLWTSSYFSAVAERADQIAVMNYETWLPTDWLYGNLVAWQTRTLRPLAIGRTTLFMGVPSYDERRMSFNPSAENLRSGLRGIRLGLSDGPNEDLTRFGVAVYANWTTDTAEWLTYRQEWLGGGQTSHR
jgi:hypothetical protein